MKSYYTNSVDYHNDLDAFEARVRAMEAEEAQAAKSGPKPVLDAVAIYEAEYERTQDWRKAAAAVEAALGDDSTAFDRERDELRTWAQGG